LEQASTYSTTRRDEMNKREAMTRAEAWYLQHDHKVARGHIPRDADGQASEDPLLCIDLVPEREAEMVQVLVDLTGEEVARLVGGKSCVRCTSSKKADHREWTEVWRRWRLKRWDKHRQDHA
jgi:hypothetical protein